VPLAGELVERARSLPGRLLGLAGAPGAGKSTLAAGLAAAVPGAVVVPMDGFHLTTAHLRELGKVETRGAPDTFDADGFVALLRRLRARDEATVRAPDFDRSIEEPVADAIAVPRTAPLVVVEGNYLLLDREPWSQITEVLDETWFVEVPEPVRVERLVARFLAFGWDPTVARDRVTKGSDAANARLVADTRPRADRVVAG
jgi:pantothenate kinase